MLNLEISIGFYVASLLVSSLMLRNFFALRVVVLRNNHLR